MGKHTHRPDRREAKRNHFAAVPAAAPRRVSWNAVIVTAGLVLLSAVVYVVGARSSGAAVTEAAIDGGDVTLPISQFDDGQARFYRYATASGREIRFFVIKSADGVVRAAFDTCDTCYRERKGYRQSGDQLLCNNCGQAFRSTDINVLKGGCNPAPLERVVQGGQVVLTAAALQAGAGYF